MAIVKCTCCARQIVKYTANDERTTGPVHSSVKDVNGLICQNCACGIDEYGMFPEEWVFVPVWDRPIGK